MLSSATPFLVGQRMQRRQVLLLPDVRSLMDEGEEMNVKPRKKVAAGGIGGAVATVLVGIADRAGFAITPAEASAIATIVGFAAAYLKSE